MEIMVKIIKLLEILIGRLKVKLVIGNRKTLILVMNK